MAAPCNEFLAGQTASNFVEEHDNFLLDCDGVLWHGSSVFPDAVETVSKLKAKGKHVFYVTNNSTKTREEYAEKLSKAGFPSVADDIICTANILAQYLRDVAKLSQKVYLIGMPSVAQELSAVGIQIAGSLGPDMPGNFKAFEDFISHIELEEGVGAVVVAFDPYISYAKIMRAASYLKNPECLYIATNSDETYPMGHSTLVFPGTGCIVSSVSTAVGKEPTLIGKPTKWGFEMIKTKKHLDPARSVVVGDRLNTDILMGYNCGIRSLAVMTGVTSTAEIQEHIDSADSERLKLVPNYWIERLGDLNKFIK